MKAHGYPRFLAGMTALLVGSIAPAQDFDTPGVPDLRTRAIVQDALVRQRLDTIVPALMRRLGVDMWILVAREYAEDPVLKAMLPATWPNARRRTILVFHDRGAEKGVERFAVARYPIGDLFETQWNPEQHPDQWARLAELVRARNPKRIAVNISEDFALADGLSASQNRQLRTTLGPLADRIVSHDSLALGYLETRTPADMAVYGAIMRAAHALIPRGLSDEAIVPGVTTTQDVVWWYRERLADQRLDAWCQPSVTIQRPDLAHLDPGRQTLPQNPVIMPGDLLHVDFCAGYMGLKTDTQMLAYVLRPGETAAPAGLRAGIADANKVQDALTAEFRTGRTGNETLAAARARAIAMDTKPVIYTHAIGSHGHGAGPWIGAWENQGGVKGLGDYPINPNTAWSIELAALRNVPEWNGKEVRFPFEVDGYFDGKSFRWIDGRQTELLLIPRAARR
jgi:hypothetical protein